jgi:hypothetical protein
MLSVQVGTQVAETGEERVMPETEKVTDCAVPETSRADIEVVMGDPAMTDLLPPLEREKSKVGKGGGGGGGVVVVAPLGTNSILSRTTILVVVSVKFE